MKIDVKNLFIKILFIYFALVATNSLLAQQKILFQEGKNVGLNKLMIFRGSNGSQISGNSHFSGSNLYENPFLEDRLVKSFNHLPKDIQASKDLVVDCDNTGRFWTISNNQKGVLFDLESNQVIFQIKFNANFPLFISPEGKYLLLNEESGERENTIVLLASSGSTIISTERKFQAEKFVLSDQLLYGEINGSEKGIIDLGNPSHFINWNGDFLCCWPPAVSLDSTKLFVTNGDEPSTLIGLPSLETLKIFPDLKPGFAFINNTGTIVGTYNGGECYFYNVSQDKSKGFSFSPVDANSLFELQGEKNRETAQLAHWKFKDYISKKIDFKTGEENEYGSSVNPKIQFRSFQRSNGGVKPHVDVVAVFQQENSGNVWVCYNRFFKDGNSDSITISVDENMEVEKVIHFSPSIKKYFWDPKSSTLKILDFNNSFAQYVLE